MKVTEIHDQAYEYYSWQELGIDIFDLSKAIIEDGKEYDRIIALAKGGLTFVRSMVDFLDVDNVSSIQVEFYSGIAETNATPVITQSLPVNIKDEKILIFDDIADSGETLQTAIPYVQFHGAKSIETAVLLQKPWSSFKCDYVARESEAWVIFPNEARETITTLRNKWRGLGDDEETIRRQLLEIGFPEPEVAFLSELE